MLIAFTPLQLVLIFVAVFVPIAVLGVIAARLLIPHTRLKVHNDMVGPIFGTIGTIYAVLLAFIVVITWESHDMTKKHISSEVSGLVGLFVEAEGFKEPMRTDVRRMILNYAESISRDEWKGLKVGKSSPVTATVLFDIMKSYASYVPSTKTEEICLAKSVDKMSDLIELRRMRQLDSREGIHPILWLMIISGSIITILMSCLFGTESLDLQLISSGLLALIIALALFTIIELDFPFTGKMALTPVAFDEMVVRLRASIS
jgi:hypothetical protein